MVKFFKILLVLFFICFLGLSNASLLNYLLANSEWSNPLNWLGSILPTLQDQVLVGFLVSTTANANYPTTTAIKVNSIELANTSTLNINTACQILQNVTIHSGCTLNFNIPINLVCGANTFLNSGTMNNNIALLKTPGFIDNSGLFLNTNETRIGGGLGNRLGGNVTSTGIFGMDGGFVNGGNIQMSGIVQLNQKLSTTGFYLLDSSYNRFEQCNFNATFRNISTFNSIVEIIDTPKFFMQNPTNVLPDAIRENWAMQGLSNVSITNSNVYIVKFTISFENNSTLSLQNTYFNTSHRLSLRDYSGLTSINSSLVSPGPLIFADHSTSHFSFNSIANTPVFGVGGSSQVFFTSSSLFITNGPRTDIPEVVGLNATSSLVFQNQSTLDLQGTFLVNDKSNLLVTNESRIDVMNNFTANQKSNVIIQDNSTITISSSMLFYDNSTFHCENSKINLILNFYFFDNSSFQIDHSELDIDGNLGLESSESTISNSKITIKGVFINSGILTSNSNDWDITQQLTTSNQLTCSNSNILLRNGIFSVKGQFIGTNSNITVLNGSGIVKDNSEFTCTSCLISIENGKFLQGIGSSISMINTTFNNKGGIVEALGDITVNNECDLSNDARFVLSSNILVGGPGGPGLPPLFNNRGLFEIAKNVNQSKFTIDLPFKNTGILRIANNIDFEGLEQSRGATSQISLIELNNVTVTSKTPLSLLSGYLKGNGSINGDVNNNGGIVGEDKEIMNIMINGSYIQSNQSNIIITVDSLTNFSYLNISGIGQFDGNITILLNTDNINTDTVKENKTISLVEYSQSQGEFSKVQILTYSKSTTSSSTDECKTSNSYSTSQTSSSFSLLLNTDSDTKCGSSDSNTESKSKIPVTTIIAVTVSIGGAFIIGSVTIYIIIHKFKYSKASVRLRQTFRR